MLIAGNWKMNTDLAEAVRLASDVARAVDGGGDAVTVAICPPFVSLEAAAEITRDTPVRLGAQNMHEAESGAFTGEISAPMLASVGCDYVILGHSERRQLFGETDKGVNRKLNAALQHGLVPILCVGETLEQREAGDEERVVGEQLRAALDGVRIDEASDLVVAYEPVWAIGTGKTASPEQAQAMHRFVRERLADALGETGRAVELLYGGSVKPDNAAELFAQPDIDGGLIGGASLDATSFAAIVNAARQQG
ncbi:MAG: triose-phosphate isomerase [Rhodothermales bacterium]